MDKKSIVNRYVNYEDIPKGEKAWITIRAKKAGKNPVMAHAGIKAAFKKKNTPFVIKNVKSITILKLSIPPPDVMMKNDEMFHVISSKNDKELKIKVRKVYDEMLEFNLNHKDYQKAVNRKEENIQKLLENRKIKVCDEIFSIINDSEMTVCL